MSKARRLGPTVLALVFFLAAPLQAGWASLGAMPAPRREGRSLIFHNAQGTVAVTVLAPEIVRVRFAPGPGLGRDHSYAVEERPATPARRSTWVRPKPAVRTSAPQGDDPP